MSWTIYTIVNADGSDVEGIEQVFYDLQRAMDVCDWKAGQTIVQYEAKAIYDGKCPCCGTFKGVGQ